MAGPVGRTAPSRTAGSTPWLAVWPASAATVRPVAATPASRQDPPPPGGLPWGRTSASSCPRSNPRVLPTSPRASQNPVVGAGKPRPQVVPRPLLVEVSRSGLSYIPRRGPGSRTARGTGPPQQPFPVVLARSPPLARRVFATASGGLSPLTPAGTPHGSPVPLRPRCHGSGVQAERFPR